MNSSDLMISWVFFSIPKRFPGMPLVDRRWCHSPPCAGVLGLHCWHCCGVTGRKHGIPGLVNIQKAMENHHFSREIHYFYGHFQWLFVCLPEGKRQPFLKFLVMFLLFLGDNMEKNQAAFYCWDIWGLKMLPSVSHFHEMIKQWMEWGAIFRQAPPEKL